MPNFYDKTDPVSIEGYAKKMIGKTFREIWEEYNGPLVKTTF